jgi:hypothetical protein
MRQEHERDSGIRDHNCKRNILLCFFARGAQVNSTSAGFPRHQLPAMLGIIFCRRLKLSPPLLPSTVEVSNSSFSKIEYASAKAWCKQLFSHEIIPKEPMFKTRREHVMPLKVTNEYNDTTEYYFLFRTL